MISNLFQNKQHIIFVLIVILIIALPPRLFKLTQFPPVIVDEPANIRDINHLLSRGGFHPADMQWDFSQATLAYYPEIFLIQLGISDKLFALRSTSVFFSLAALIPFFFIVKKYTTTQISFCVTLLLSYSYYYLQFSRGGWGGTLYATTLGLYLLWIIEDMSEKNNKILSILAGIFASLIFYTYRGGEVYIIAGFIFILVKIYTLKQPIQNKLLSFFLFFMIFLIFSFPWIRTITSNWERFTLRSRVVSVFQVSLPYHNFSNLPTVLFYQVTTTMKSWILLLPVQGGGSEDPRYLPGTYPPISPLLIPLFYVGVVTALIKWRKTFLWFFIFVISLIFGQIFTVDPPNGARGFIFLPIIYLFCAFGIYNIYIRYKHTRWFTPALRIFTIIIMMSDLLFYIYWMTWIKV